jgi:hypothetical protein
MPGAPKGKTRSRRWSSPMPRLARPISYFLDALSRVVLSRQKLMDGLHAGGARHYLVEPFHGSIMARHCSPSNHRTFRGSNISFFRFQRFCTHFRHLTGTLSRPSQPTHARPCPARLAGDTMQWAQVATRA